MNKRRKALSVALATALLIPVLTVTAFGAINGDLYAGYIEGNTRLGENQYLTDPAARDLYNDLIFVSGGVGSASASGYGNFYTYISPATNTYRYEFGKTNPVIMGDGNTYTTDDIKPIGNIKWVLHDGVLIITNDWTDAEVEAKISQSASEVQQEVARETMTQMNFLNYETSYLELTPFRNNAHIETIIIGDNIDYNWARAVFVGCENIKNIICLDGGFYKLVEGSNPEYIIVDGGERSGEFYGTTDGTADVTAYQSSSDRMDFTAYTPGTKGNVTIGIPTKNREHLVNEDRWNEWWTYPDASTIASQYATAKSYVADMNLPDWALAFLPVEMGGTGTAREVGDVFNFTTATLKSNWSDSTDSTTETPVVEPENPVTETPAADKVTYSAWAEEDIMAAGMIGYLDTLPASNEPAVTDLLGDNYTVAITRGQFAAIAVRFYEKLMADAERDSEIAVAPGDDVFADCQGNEAVAKAFNIGILGGYNSANSRSGVYVGPDDPITREQAATMLARLMEVIETALDRNQLDYVDYTEALPFTDSISDWAVENVKVMYQCGIMSGTSGTTFSTSSNYTIEQAIVTIMRTSDWARAGRG